MRRFIFIFFSYTISFCFFCGFVYAQEADVLLWNKTVLKIYTNDKNFIPLINNIFREWLYHLDGRLTTVTINNQDDADIIIFFTNKLPTQRASDEIAYTNIIYKDNSIYKVKVYLNKINIKENRLYTKKELRRIILHEIGHTLGIVEHSNNPDDIMYMKTELSSEKGPTKADTKRLLSIYNKKNNLTTKDIKKLINKEKILTQKYPLNIEYKITLGNLYKQNKMYKEALAEYRKAKNLDRDNIDANYNICILYDKLGDDKSSYDCLNDLIINYGETPIFLYSFAVTSIKNNKTDLIKEYLNKFIQNNPQEKNNIIIQDTLDVLQSAK